MTTVAFFVQAWLGQRQTQQPAWNLLVLFDVSYRIDLKQVFLATINKQEYTALKHNFLAIINKQVQEESSWCLSPVTHYGTGKSS